MGATIPCYLSAHATRRTALVCEARPAAAASLAFPRLIEGRFNPRLFNGLLLFLSDAQLFPFTEVRVVLRCQTAALATFALAPFTRVRKKIPFVVSHWKFNIINMLS
jgi:hypothetical protein